MTTRRICIVSTGHPSTNPRLVKEADALSAAGYDVRVVASKFIRWADAADAEFDDRPWHVEWVRFGEMAPRPVRLALALRQRLAREAVVRLGPRPPLLRLALHYVTPTLARVAVRRPADLYIAHNLGALPAAVGAARHHGARVGFDAEDFHRGEFHDGPGVATQRALVVAAEEHWIPQCHYVTAASDGIAEAYAERLGIPRPTTVLNVFPLEDRNAAVSADALADEVPEGGRSLHWFSQTIGPGRGLEDAVQALPLLPEDVVLSLRGGWAGGYERDLRGLADRLGVGRRLRALGHCPPDELVRRAAEHEVGLALEPGDRLNNDLAVSNKLFTYLLAGLPTAATATTGQRSVCALVPEATRLYAPGEVPALAGALRDLLGNMPARRAALRAGHDRFNWDVEREGFLDLVRRTLAAS